MAPRWANPAPGGARVRVGVSRVLCTGRGGYTHHNSKDFSRRRFSHYFDGPHGWGGERADFVARAGSCSVRLAAMYRSTPPPKHRSNSEHRSCVAGRPSGHAARNRHPCTSHPFRHRAVHTRAVHTNAHRPSAACSYPQLELRRVRDRVLFLVDSCEHGDEPHVVYPGTAAEAGYRR